MFFGAGSTYDQHVPTKRIKSNWNVTKHTRNKNNKEWDRYCKMRQRKKRTQKNKRIEASIKRGEEKREMMRTKDKRLYNLLDEYNHKKMDDGIKALMDKNCKIQTTDTGIKKPQLDQGRKLFQSPVKNKPKSDFTPLQPERKPEKTLSDDITLEEFYYAIDRSKVAKVAGPEDRLTA